MSASRVNGRATLAAIAVLLALSPLSARAQSPAIVSAPSRVAAGADYASDVLHDPWDFSNVSDLSPFPDEIGGWTNSSAARTTGRSAFLSNGQFTARTATGSVHSLPMLFRGGADFITSRLETSGVEDYKAIPTAIFGKLAVMMTLSASTGGQLAAFWYASPYGAPGEQAQGVAFKTPRAGRRLYWVDLVSGVWLDDRGNPASPAFLPIGNMSRIAWQGAPYMRGFQLWPTSDANAQVDVQIDWVRLTARDGTNNTSFFPLTFSGCASRDYNVEVQVDTNVWDIIHTDRAGAGSTTTANVNHGVLPPGSWNFRVTCYPGSRSPSGGTGVSSSPVTVVINAPPIVTVHNPDIVGGADFAATVLGNPWDMNALSDIALSHNVTNMSIASDGVTNAFQATATTSDPEVVLLNGAANIDTSRYRHLTFALTLDTPFGLNGNAGEGSVARIFWERPSATGGNVVTTTQDILVWPGRNVYNIDLTPLTTSNGGLEVDCLPGCQQVPWASSPVRYLRIDPHESTLGVRFRLGATLLTAHDEAAPGAPMAIQYSFTDADGGAAAYHARIYLDSDQNAASKVQIAEITSGVVPNTMLTYSFDPSQHGVPAGEYYVLVEITEVHSAYGDTRGRFSSGPVRVGTGGGGPTLPGPPALRGVQTGSNPVTVAWSPGTGSAPTSYTLAAGTSPGASNLGVFNMGLQTSAGGNVPLNTPIYVRVTASNAVGSATSNEISFITGALTAPGVPILQAPGVAGRQVTLVWSPPATGGPPAYYLVVARYMGSQQIIATLPVAGNTLTVPNVPPATYVVTVVAVNAAGMSAESGGTVVPVQ